MENAVLVVKHFSRLATTCLASAELAEILSCSGNHVFEKLEDDSSFRLLADGDVEVNARILNS